MVRRFAFSFALMLTLMMLVFSDWVLSVETGTMSTIEQSINGPSCPWPSSRRDVADIVQPDMQTKMSNLSTFSFTEWKDCV